MKKPVIAIPIGDPAGVGPEIVAKSIASDEVFQIAVCVIVGDRKIVEKAIEITGENLKINEIKEPEEAVDEKGVLNLINLDNVDKDTFAYGKVSIIVNYGRIIQFQHITKYLPEFCFYFHSNFLTFLSYYNFTSDAQFYPWRFSENHLRVSANEQFY